MRTRLFSVVMSMMTLIACETKNLLPVQQENDDVTLEVALSMPKRSAYWMMNVHTIICAAT